MTARPAHALDQPILPAAARPAAARPAAARLAPLALPRDDVEQIEIALLLEAIRRRWGYDFTQYSPASIRRRLEHAREEGGFDNFSAMQTRALHDELYFHRLLRHLSVSVTEMFRDPEFYAKLRERVIPLLKTYPFVKIWCAGCATGEEVYSLAILLHEAGYLERTRFYATDFNRASLAVAEKGIYPERMAAGFAENYRQAGGQGAFPDYYSNAYEYFRMKHFLRDRITVSYHNLVTDGVFGEMHLILCRNVMIYFDRVLRDHVLQLLTASLTHGGHLCLGNSESLSFSAVNHCYAPIEGRQRIYKKLGIPAHD